MLAALYLSFFLSFSFISFIFKIEQPLILSGGASFSSLFSFSFFFLLLLFSLREKEKKEKGSSRSPSYYYLFPLFLRGLFLISVVCFYFIHFILWGHGKEKKIIHLSFLDL
jgi:hypothetical protein